MLLYPASLLIRQMYFHRASYGQTVWCGSYAFSAYVSFDAFVHEFHLPIVGFQGLHNYLDEERVVRLLGDGRRLIVAPAGPEAA